MTAALTGTRPPSTAARTVLLVDDETRLREMLTTAVGDMGFVVTPARSAEVAMKAIESQSFDIVILDLNLPGMSGMEFFEILRQKMPEGQVIILTGFGTLEDTRMPGVPPRRVRFSHQTLRARRAGNRPGACSTEASGRLGAGQGGITAADLVAAGHDD